MIKSIFLLALVATSVSLTFAGISRGERPLVLINRPPPPKQNRFAREANPQGSVSASYQKPLSGPDRRPTYNVDYQNKFFENKHGHFSAGGGAVQFPGKRWEPAIGVPGSWRF